MKKSYSAFLILVCAFWQFASAQTVTVQVDVSKGRKAISPYIYGKNSNVSDDPGSPTTAAQWKMMREAGLRFTRENGGNNASKYNWRLKISSHPDWYNNVYAHNWDYAAKTLGDSMPGVQGMWAFQLIGKAASNTSNNFNDYAYNGSSWWSGVEQNLAGGGVPNSSGGSAATTEGNPNLYLENWTADSSVAILDHWFGTGGLGYNKNNIVYWSMDNEPDIWNSTHDDIVKTEPDAETFMQTYFTVAKKARAKYPNIKLTGPVPATEWQWYAWNNTKITVGGQSYVWLQYFIKRIAEEQVASGIRLLDVIDIHSYPNESNDSDIVQLHRIYFDSTYNYPGANGVKTTSASGWDNTITNEDVFGRCTKWLNQYMGAGNGVTFSVSEYGPNNNSADVTAVSYASVLGTFADNNVEFFSPWDWYPGMWETLHLYSHYGKSTRVQSVSSNEHDVSAYSSINNSGDSMTVVLVNRSLSATHATTLNLANFMVANGTYDTRQLSGLPSTETFISNSNNALKAGTATAASNSLSISLPALSTTAIILKGTSVTGLTEMKDNNLNVVIYPNPNNGNFVIETNSAEKQLLTIFDISGRLVLSQFIQNTQTTIDASNLMEGVYTISITGNEHKINKRLVVVK